MPALFDKLQDALGPSRRSRINRLVLGDDGQAVETQTSGLFCCCLLLAK